MPFIIWTKNDMALGRFRRNVSRAVAAFIFSALASAAAAEPVREVPRQYAAFAETPSGIAAFSINLGRDHFFPSEILNATVTGTPRKMLDSNAAVAVLAPGGAVLSIEYIHKRDSSLSLRAPLAPGRYELAGYADGASVGGANAVARVPFTVMESSAGMFSVSLDKTRYQPAEMIKAFVSGVPGEAIAASALVGVYANGGASGKYISYEYVKRNGETVTLRAPDQPGEYEVRAFTNGTALSELTTAARVPFMVGGSASGAFRVSTPRENYLPGEMMTVRVSGVPKHMIDGGALLGVAVSGADPVKFISYTYITAPDGSYEFEAPLAAGEYEILGYTNNNILSDATLASTARFRVAE